MSMDLERLKALTATYDAPCAMCGERRASVEFSPKLDWPDAEGNVTIFPCCITCAHKVDFVQWVKDQKKALRTAKQGV